MAASKQGGTYRRQDAIVVAKDSPGALSHAEWRLLKRGGEFATDNIRALWREAVPVPSKSSQACTMRYHEASELLLVSSFGCIKTVYRLDDRPADEQARIKREARRMQE
ncbi:hypothetical protein [Haloferax volcanii]|uniref:hypothetical protein n=1 Tax=Haloferax volcanii TaxID=2246 RepID=UPI00249C9B39|nr:hypothetical protein [Haloferax alexandrinus]